MKLDNLMERMLMVKAMDYVARQLNDESHLMYWLSNGVADEDIPYGELSLTGPIDRDPAFWYAEDEERFGELMGDFLKIMARAYKNGGIYCGDVSSKEDPPAVSYFGIVKWTNADLAEALEENNIPATEENIATLRDECENNHHFTEPMIAAGWDTINNYIMYLDDCDSFETEEEEEDIEPDDSNIEMGFDPYMGCYTEDC